MKTVLFSSDRPLERAENLKAVWDAYEGPKEFMQHIPEACKALCDRYSVFVVDCTPQYSPTKGEIVTIYVSHGISGDKLFGLDKSEHHRAGVEQVDYAICTTDYCSMRVQSQFALPPERVLHIGMPITDNYVGKTKGDGGTILARYARAYLYAPTWRAWGNPHLPRIDWRKVDSMMEDDEIVAVKRHMCTKGNLVDAKYEHVVEFGNMIPTVPYLIDCVVLATDFSSILFDGYILGKPSVLVIDGAREYLESQGMYEKYPEWYGSRYVCAEGGEQYFLDQLRAAAKTGMGEVERRCRDITAGECDGHAAERVAGLISKFA